MVQFDSRPDRRSNASVLSLPKESLTKIPLSDENRKIAQIHNILVTVLSIATISRRAIYNVSAEFCEYLQGFSRRAAFPWLIHFLLFKGCYSDKALKLKLPQVSNVVALNSSSCFKSGLLNQFQLLGTDRITTMFNNAFEPPAIQPPPPDSAPLYLYVKTYSYHAGLALRICMGRGTMMHCTFWDKNSAWSRQSLFRSWNLDPCLHFCQRSIYKSSSGGIFRAKKPAWQ